MDQPISTTILVVDDSEDNRTLALEKLRRNGYDPISVIDGADALAYLATHDAPGAILLDLRMPNMNGWQFLAKQQTEPTIASIPVVIFSAEPHYAREFALTPNVVGCVCKTAGSEALLDAIRIALACPRAKPYSTPYASQ
jgi:two-component system cell cycle response regulator